MKQFAQIPLLIALGVVALLLFVLNGAGEQNLLGALGALAQSNTPDGAYHIDIDPDDFVRTIDNKYLPLIPGTTYIYEGQTAEGLERIEVTVLHKTKEVMGVKTAVVRDTVYVDGVIIEDTLDWFAQDKKGNVWYFGEAVDNYEDGVLVDHEGSWEAGVDGALPGIAMWDDPKEHLREQYRIEYYPGFAEDMAKILSVEEKVNVPFGTFDDVLKTMEWTPLEPGALEHKFYAEEIGLIKVVALDTGETIELIDIIEPADDDNDDNDNDGGNDNDDDGGNDNDHDDQTVR